ncbi:MAG: ATP-binding protein [Methanomicrobiales archaeon]|nr:ATP-binding protein [Methanomicrobiales archaeon]
MGNTSPSGKGPEPGINESKQTRQEREDLLRKVLQSEEALRSATEELQAATEKLTACNKDLRVHGTELTRLAQELRENEAKYLDLFENAPDGYLVTDPSGMITEANQTISQLLRDNPKSLAGRNFSAFIIAENGTLPAKLEDLVRGNRINSWVTAVQPTEGELISVRINIIPVRGSRGSVESLRWTVRDVREETTTSQYLENLITIANAPIIVWDPQFRITRFNHAFERLTGRAADAVIGKPLEILFPSSFKTDCMDLFRRTVGGERWEGVEIPIQHVDGEVKTVLWNSATLYGADGVTVSSVIAQGQDITERKHIADALNHTVAELKRSNEDLERFAYVASHDLQEPLRNVKSFTQLLSKRYEGKLDQDADEFIGYIVDGTSRMQDLVSDLLEYSRVTTRGEPFRSTDLGEALHFVTDSLSTLIDTNGAFVSYDPLPVVMGDYVQLTQVFQNLIENAIKFHGSDPPRIHISAQDLGKEWQFSVRDNGIGIDPQYHERIFVMFQRLHHRSAFAGTGIGLAICKRIIERHGGRIWVESEPGTGSTFFFTIPSWAKMKH